MKKHTKIYLDYFRYGEQDFIPCENCRTKAVDIHHINYKSRGGKDEIENLVGLCRVCHAAAHAERIKPKDLQTIHNRFLKNEFR